jgi:hypothetical protein
MSAAAVATPLVDADTVIAQARAILTANRGFKADEQQKMRDALYRLGERDRFSHDVLMAVVAEIERRVAERAQNASIATVNAAISARVEHERRRPERWAALSPIQRAGCLMDDGTTIGRLFAKFAALVEDERAAQLAPPQNFEPERS